MKQIILKGRGCSHILEQVEDDKYILHTDYNYRVGKVTDANYFIDPSGGPFMTKGTIINDFHIVDDVIVEEGKPIYLIVKEYDLPSNTKSRTV